MSTHEQADNVSPDPGYKLAASGRQETEDERLVLLEQVFDPAFGRRLPALFERCGLRNIPAWRLTGQLTPRWAWAEENSYTNFSRL